MDRANIPTREEHDRIIRKIWMSCFAAAGACFVAMLGMVVVMAGMGYDSKTIVNAQLIAVYIVVPVYAVGYIGPSLATSLMKMSLGVEMSRHGIELGQQTADVMNNLKLELLPILKDSRKLTEDLKLVVKQFQGDGPKAVIEFVEKLAKDGTVERVIKTVEDAARRIHEVVGTKPSATGGASREDLIPVAKEDTLSDRGL